MKENMGEFITLFYQAVFNEMMRLLEIEDYITIKKMIRAILEALGEILDEQNTK